MAEAFLQTGGCHCGALRYSVSAPPIATYVCHCTDCQSLSGAAFAIGVVVAEAAFHLTGAPKAVPRVLGSGLISQRLVCAACGVWVCGGSRSEAGPDAAARAVRVVRGGTFDDTSWLRPTMHFWTRSRQPWVVLPEGVEVHETQPEVPPPMPER